MEYNYETLEISVEEGIAVVKLNRPEKMNPLSLQMLGELGEVFIALRKDDDVKVVVLTGAGRAFSAGGDLNDMLVGGLKLDYTAGRILGQTIQSIQAIEKPVIGAANGIAAGGGAGLLLACDFVYASEKAKFSEIYANIGMVPDCGNLWLLPRVVGPLKAKEMCFTAEIIDAQEMLRLGIAQKVFTVDEFWPKVMELAHKLAEGPALVYKFSKTIIDRGWGMSLEQFYDLEAFALDIVMRSEDFKEGMTAFIEKRKAVYKGK